MNKKMENEMETGRYVEGLWGLQGREAKRGQKMIYVILEVYVRYHLPDHMYRRNLEQEYW